MKCPISGHRGLVLVLLAALAGVSRGAQARTAGPPVPTEEIGNGVYVFRYGAYRSLFVANDAGVIVTDPLNEEAASLYLKEIRKITAAPVTRVISVRSESLQRRRV